MKIRDEVRKRRPGYLYPGDAGFLEATLDWPGPPYEWDGGVAIKREIPNVRRDSKQLPAVNF